MLHDGTAILIQQQQQAWAMQISDAFPGALQLGRGNGRLQGEVPQWKGLLISRRLNSVQGHFGGINLELIADQELLRMGIAGQCRWAKRSVGPMAHRNQLHGAPVVGIGRRETRGVIITVEEDHQHGEAPQTNLHPTAPLDALPWQILAGFLHIWRFGHEFEGPRLHGHHGLVLVLGRRIDAALQLPNDGAQACQVDDLAP
mmetsp:Transcript_60284/g.122444  ORF Transcript_60284/g.122444 Transcript_60284/m.122444 type:complete len:201 (-) Transcript_60284:790-1392(-)